MTSLRDRPEPHRGWPQSCLQPSGVQSFLRAEGSPGPCRKTAAAADGERETRRQGYSQPREPCSPSPVQGSTDKRRAPRMECLGRVSAEASSQAQLKKFPPPRRWGRPLRSRGLGRLFSDFPRLSLWSVRINSRGRSLSQLQKIQLN